MFQNSLDICILTPLRHPARAILLIHLRRSNDNLKSNLHRVVEPPAERELSDGLELTKERFSIPYFIQADRNKVVQCAPGLEGSGAIYPPVSAGEYLRKRVNATFKKFS
jgi:isopenicillin N synthase-like dioxygenase